jgi:HD-GYP domain-containing protein (c-di-GMP phosphodiesterase class II)
MSANRQAGVPFRGIRSFPLHIHIATLFSLLLAVTVTVVSLFHYHQTRRVTLAAQRQAFERLGALASDALEQSRERATRVVDLLSRSELAHGRTLAARLDQLELLQEVLRLEPTVARVSVGYTNGDLFSVQIQGAEASPGQASTSPVQVESLAKDSRWPDQARRMDYDAQLRPLGSTIGAAPDPRLTPWYQQAINHDRLVTLVPVPAPGEPPTVILARRSATGRSAVAAEMQLARLGAAVAGLDRSPSTWVVLLSDGRPILRIGKVDEAFLARLLSDGTRGGQDTQGDADGRIWRLSQAALTSLGDTRLDLLLAAPEDELFVEADRIMARSLWISLALLLAALPVTWYASCLVAHPLRQLAGEARAVQELRFPPPGFTHSIVSEVDDLGGALGAMQEALRRFLDTGRMLSAQRDFASLVQQVLDEALDVAGLTHGALYLLSRDETQLEPIIVRQGEQGLKAPTESGFRPLSVHGDSHLLAALTWGIHPQPILGGLAQALAEYLPLAPTQPGEEAGRLLAIPLEEHKGVLVGALWLHLPGGATAPAADRQAYLSALADVAAIALQNHRLLQGRTALLEAVVAMTAGAIDAKSPYTGGHCQRVATLLAMLAEAACRAEHGPFTDFRLDAAGWETLRMAGWLHDCGKITTPDYVIDKATKLETLHNRLHEIRMRFEVLKRDAQIAYWREASRQGSSTPEMASTLARTLMELDQEFAFVARCNQSTEPLTEDDRRRLGRIAHRTWLRTLDDTIGLSREERTRKPETPASLPVVEKLLADKPEHLIPHHVQHCYPPDNPWGFQVSPSPHRLNLGELHNLLVDRGTLTPEERHLINDHIVQTIVMLSRLPFPRELAAVPEIAGAHHEHLDGSGYPRGLASEQLSLTARMLALADVFEALTAADRPYKHGKTSAEATVILQGMAVSGHLDQDVLNLALASGVFDRYAGQFLSPPDIQAMPEQALPPGPELRRRRHALRGEPRAHSRIPPAGP